MDGEKHTAQSFAFGNFEQARVVIEAILTYAFLKQVFLAAAGGFCLNMMNLYEDSKRQPSERVSKDCLYFVMFAFWPFAGALLGFLYVDSGNQINGLLAFHVGLSAPVLMQAMVKVAAPVEQQNTDVED